MVLIGHHRAGFDTVCQGSETLKMFVPSELELAICGTREFDFTILRRVTRYDGYEATDNVILWYVCN